MATLLERIGDWLRPRSARLRAKAAPPSPRPSLTIVRLIGGATPQTFDELVAALNVGYPGDVETLLVFANESDPVLPVAAAAIAHHRSRGGRGRVEIFVAGMPRESLAGSLIAVTVAAECARGELIVLGN